MNDACDVLRLNGLVVDCIVGIHPHERQKRQPLVASLAFHLDSRRAAFDGRLDHTVDYARVAGEVAFVLAHGDFLLIETAAEVVARVVLAGAAAITDVDVTLEKPHALGGRGLPSLTIHREREATTALWTYAFGVVDVVWNHGSATNASPTSAPSTPNQHALGLYRLRLKPGASMRVPPHTTVFDVDADLAGALASEPVLTNASEHERAYLLLARPPLRLDAFVAVSGA